MKMLSLAGVLALFATATLAAACGGSVVTGTGGGHSGGGGTGGGGAPPTGDCQSDADCGGSTCAAVTPGGYKICLGAPPEATGCVPGAPVPDECCTSADCAQGKCYDNSMLPYCGGPFPAPYNTCVSDACQSDADCGAQQICAPAGAWGRPNRACVAASCHTNADCGAGGACVPIIATCCGTPQGLACVFPGGCSKDSDCASDGSTHCEIKDGKGQCVPGFVGCPA